MSFSNCQKTAQFNSIEEYGSYIMLQNNLLIKEKMDNYQLITDDKNGDFSSEHFTSYTNSLPLSTTKISPIGVNSLYGSNNNSTSKDYKSVFTSPQELKLKSKRKISSLLSTSDKPNELKSIQENPFKSLIFKKKLNFYEDV
jgi:hypothetical protein